MRNIIRLRTYHGSVVKIHYDDVYKYTRKNKFTDFLFWVLKKLGTIKIHCDETEKISVIDIDEQKLTDKIVRVMRDMGMNHMKPSMVYIGPREMDELVYECRDINYYLDFNVKMGYNATIFNLPVTIVPHMDGILVI